MEARCNWSHTKERYALLHDTFYKILIMRIFCKVQVYVYLGMEIGCKAGFLHSLLHSLCRHMPEAGCHIPDIEPELLPHRILNTMNTRPIPTSYHSLQKKNEIPQCISRLSKYHYSFSKVANNFLLLKVLSHFFRSDKTKCGRTYKKTNKAKLE